MWSYGFKYGPIKRSLIYNQNNIMHWGRLLFFLPVCFVLGGNPDAKRLYDDLLSNYNKLVRPVINVTEAVTVRLKLKLSQLIDVVSFMTHSSDIKGLCFMKLPK